MKRKKAVVLLSGGLDSSTCLYWARARNYEPYALLFDYGQRHRKELQCALRLARKSGVPAHTVRFSLPWGGSSLTNRRAALPHDRSASTMSSGIPSTYVPARNTIFLSFAFSYADAMGAEAVVIGANAVDYSGYPDCRPDYLKSMERSAKLGTRSGSEGRGIRILSPLVHLSKAQIIRLGNRLGVPYGLTWSCYQGGKRPCGRCDSCLLREKGFQEAGVPDPLVS
jgi:7-cyano-7-deazaguanine synthase